MRISKILLLILITLLLSCEKDTTIPEKEPENPVTSEYMPLKIGNYWIYQWFQTDMDGNEKFVNIIDSVFISKDTLIHNRKYYKLDRSRSDWDMYIPRFISDSSGYLLSGPGVIILSPDSTKTFVQEGSTTKLTSYTCRKDSMVNTPAGIFSNTITYRTLREANDGSPAGYLHRVFAKNIGMIQRSLFYAGSPDKPIGVKLLRYHVN